MDQKSIIRVLGQNLYRKRNALGLTQKELADKLKIPKSNLSYAESGLGNPSVYLIYRLSQFYKVSMNQLMTPEPSKFAIGAREELSLRVLPGGSAVEEAVMNEKKMVYRNVRIPAKGTMKVPAGPKGSKEIWVCQKGSIWIRSKLDSRLLNPKQILEVECHLPKLIYGDEAKESQFTIFRVQALPTD